MPFATVNGVRLCYSDIGRGLPLLCLHGGMGIDARPLHVPGILNLRDDGVRLIIPDQRGHGASDAPGVYRHADWIADAHALMQHLGLPRFALLGHSYGGFLALEYALQWPDTVSHLILVGTSAGPVRASTATFATDADLRAHLRTVWPTFFSRKNKHWWLFDKMNVHAAPYNAAFAHALPAYDVRARVGALTMPALLIVGEHDVYRAPMTALADLLPDAMLCELKAAGHFPFLEAEALFTARVRAFLKDNSG